MVDVFVYRNKNAFKFTSRQYDAISGIVSGFGIELY